MHDEYPGSGVIRRKFPDICNRVPAKCPDWQTDNDLGSRKRNEKSPGEMMPTRGRILHINRYFIKTNRLNQEKPCNIAGWSSPGHQVFFFGCPESEMPNCGLCCLKNFCAGKWVFSTIFKK